MYTRIRLFFPLLRNNFDKRVEDLFFRRMRQSRVLSKGFTDIIIIMIALNIRYIVIIYLDYYFRNRNYIISNNYCWFHNYEKISFFILQKDRRATWSDLQRHTKYEYGDKGRGICLFFRKQQWGELNFDFPVTHKKRAKNAEPHWFHDHDLVFEIKSWNGKESYPPGWCRKLFLHVHSL